MIKQLLDEAKAIQKRLFYAKRTVKQNTAKSFCNLILQGKVSAACKLINRSSSSGPLKVNNAVLQVLKEKHPPAQEGGRAIMDNETPNIVQQIIYENIDSETVYRSAMQTKGSGGPSKVDSEIWRQLCCSKSFLPASENLCEQIAIMARRLCRGYVDPECLTEYTAGRLIPLDKGSTPESIKLRPIGIGEILRRIVGKSVLSILKSDITNAAGPLQTCAGVYTYKLITYCFVNFNCQQKPLCV